jgi:hypothetical protein
MEAVRTSETSVDNHFTRQYNPEDSSEHHTRRRENLKSHICDFTCKYITILFPFLYVNYYVFGILHTNTHTHTHTHTHT